MPCFERKSCFITGGAHGIGFAIVEAFHAAGARVAFCDIDVEGGEKSVGKLMDGMTKESTDEVPARDGKVGSASDNGSTGDRVMFRQVDVNDAAALTAFMDEVHAAWGDIDIIVNNVGISVFSPLVDTSVEQFDRIVATNLRPVFVTSREMARRRAAKYFSGERRYGRIINIASTRWLQSEPGTEGYSASKGGIVSLTHALAASLAGTGVTVNCISPGWINTGHYGELRPVDHSQHPSGRVGVPEDIARACMFLAAPENDFINGQNFVVDGGMTRRMIYVE